MTHTIQTLNNYLQSPLTNLTSGFVKLFVKIYEVISLAQTKKAIALVKQHMWANKLYKDTYNELSKLSDKELRDIGLTRGMIHSVAMDVVSKHQAETNPNLRDWV